MQRLDDVASFIANLPDLSRDKTLGPANSWKCKFTSDFVGDPVYHESKIQKKYILG
jgi:hypothetical protein